MERRAALGSCGINEGRLALQSRPAHARSTRVLLIAAILGVCAVAAMAGCGASVRAGSGGHTGGGNSAGSSASPTDAGTWVTVEESSGASVSSGGSSSNSSQQTTNINGAYRVMAACQGGGSLELQLDPGGAVNVQCTAAKQEPVRVAGSDSAPAGDTLSVSIVTHGDITWSDVLVQVRR